MADALAAMGFPLDQCQRALRVISRANALSFEAHFSGSCVKMARRGDALRARKKICGLIAPN